MQEPRIPFQAPPVPVILTLRDGSRIQIDDMSASRVKHLRRSKGTIKIVSGETIRELKGSEIKGIESIPSPPSE